MILQQNEIVGKTSAFDNSFGAQFKARPHNALSHATVAHSTSGE